MALTSGTKLGPYEIQSLIGSGGMGEVYRALDSRLQRTVAIKILPAHLASNADLRARFEQEARSISSLQHPNICVIHDIGNQGGVHFIVMEYVSGKTLDKLIPSGDMATDLALKYGLQIADALARAHAAGIVHRDLKPANIMVDESGLVKILDFGLAKPTGNSSSQSDAMTMATTPGMIVGTAAYMSPEQAEGKPIDARSDVFSFGAVFYEMLTGKRAFEGQSSAALLAAITRDDPKPLGAMRRDAPPEIQRIVARCLKKDPAARYASGTELATDLRTCRELLFPESGALLSPARIAREVRRPRVMVPLFLVVLMLGAGIFWLVKRSRDARWAREVAIPQISQLADQGQFGQAYALAVKAQKIVPDDPVLAKLWPTITYQLTLDTNPSGAEVYRRNYSDANAPWEFVGTTPINSPQPRGMFLWKFQKQGYGTALRMSTAIVPRWSVPPGEKLLSTVTLDETGKIPPGMVRISPEKYFTTLFIPGYEGMPELELKDFWMDQYEVTNRQFKAFIDQGGYQKREYWKIDFQKAGKQLPWDQAMALFLDSAGRPGPNGWIQGEYPKGQDDYPVTGISWYEAAAYAEFAGKTLPTIYHWNRAGGAFTSAYIVPMSNFAGTGVLPVGTKSSIGPWGTYDMAGNVKEWVWNEADGGRRYVLGGAWDEPTYMFIDPDAQSPFLRASNIGFRCVKYIDPESIPKIASDVIPAQKRDFSKEKPASDELFKAYRSLYSYDKTPLNAKAEPWGTDNPDWAAERVTYTAAYGNEQAILYLLLPKKAKPPFQTVLFFPGSGAIQLRQFSLYSTAALDAIVRSGRAVVYPVYKSTYERGDDLTSDVPDMSSRWRDHVIMWTKDASRALDYADTRPELDHEKIAYYGYSWGAAMGALVPAVEPRIKTCVFALGGLEFQRSLPEADPINFITRVKQPALMLNGRFDFFFPIQTNQEPFYQMLGTKKDEKKHILYDTGHNIPRNELIKETLNWLDQYLGTVN